MAQIIKRAHCVVLRPDHFKFASYGPATWPYIALSRVDCRVRANQIAVFGYVTLIAT